MDIRSSTAAEPNPSLREVPRQPGEDNVAWLSRVAGRHDAAGSLVLLGGVGLTDFRLRVAQSNARRDLLPSFWSHIVLLESRAGDDWPLYEISLEPAHGFGAVALQNGIQQGSMMAYADPLRYPNIAHIGLSATPDALPKGATFADVVRQAVFDLQKQRAALDLAALVVEWLGYAWGVADRGNPLQRNLGLPSAVFVQSVFGIAGIELTPGAASQSTCPEAIWQAAKWWHEFYASDVTLTQAAPAGAYAVDQPAAAPLAEPQGFRASSSGRRGPAASGRSRTRSARSSKIGRRSRR